MTHSEPAREAVACLYTVQGDSQPFTRISRGMLHVAGDIVAVQPLGPLPTSPAPATGVEAVRSAALEEAARLIEQNELLHTSGGDELRPRSDGNRNGLSYADAIRKLAALTSPAATSAPTYVVNCCNCGRIIDTREESEGGDQWGHQLSDNRWVCSPECLDAVTDPDATSAATRGEPVAITSEMAEAGRKAIADERARVGMQYPDTLAVLAYRAMSAVAPPPAPVESAQVKVRPLEWVKHPSANIWRAECLLGVYQLYNIQTPVWLFDGFTDRVHDKRADSVDAGFAAAQADYESRIRASLDLATDAEG